MCSKLFDARIWAPLFLGLGSWTATEPPVVQGTSAGVSGGVAGGTAADVGVVCDETGNPGHCQLPDQLGHGAEGIIGATSDASATVPYAVSERVANESGVARDLTQICWWGFYLDFAAPQADCSDDPAIGSESFNITVYYDTSDYLTGCPNSVPDGVYRSYPGIAFLKAATGNQVEAGGGTIFLDEYEYTATLVPPVSLRPNTCYWIEIQNDTTGTASDSCAWLWQTAPPGDNVSAQDTNGDGVYIQAETNDFDMAICLDVAIGDTSICDPMIDVLCVDAVEPCALPHTGVGCDDPCCCTLVCEIDPSCCDTAWVQDCADLAISEGCARLGYPVCIATGPDNAAEGYLKICSDPYGSWSDDSYGAGPDDPDWGDEYRPAGSDLQAPTFTVGFYVFMADTHRELLTTNDAWKGGQPTALDDDSLVSQFAGVTSLDFDTNGDGVSDTLTSSFTVTGTGVNLAFDLTQKVTTGGVLPAGVSVMTQTLVINNLDSQEISFELLRHLDADLLWSGGASPWLDDSVGTDTNGSPLDRFVYQHEVGSGAQAVTISSDHGDQYYGSINFHDPDDAGPCPPMGYGTDTQIWENYGVPCAWENYIAFVGYDIDGESGDQQQDGSIGLEMPVTIAGLGRETVIFQTTYGATTPRGQTGDVVPDGIGFHPPQEFSADGPPIIHALGDLDGDQAIDVAAVIPNLSPSAPGKVQIFHNLGNGPGGWLGLLKDDNTIDVGADPSGIVLGLFNGDPHLDMAVTNKHDGDVWTFFNNGSAVFTINQQIPTGNGPSAITSGHYNADAFLDLAVTNEGDSEVVILFGDVNGDFTVGPAPVGPGRGMGVDQSPVAILSDDFDNNDDDDLAGASRGTARAGRQATAWVLLGQGDGTFVESDSVAIGANPMDVSSGDVTRDNFADIVTANAGDNTVSVLVNQHDGTFVSVLEAPVGSGPRSIRAVDLDNDLDHDLVVVAGISSVRLVQVLENRSAPGVDIVFAAPLSFEVDADANHVVAGDLNADGLADLVTVNEDDGKTSGSVTVLLGDPGAAPRACWCDCENPPDGAVDVGDFLALLSQWGEPGYCDCEEPPDGTVDVGDFLALLAGWGPCP